MALEAFNMGIEIVNMVTVLALWIGGYFLPTIVAIYRKHKNQNAISVLNLLLAWTIIGWIACLVWACTDNVNKAKKKKPKKKK